MAKINEGASILLTWIINLIKWNAGVVKYRFKATESSVQKRSLDKVAKTDDLDVPSHKER